MIKLISIVVGGFFLLLAFQCKKKQQTCEPIESVSYSQHIQPIFNANCINCHGGNSPDGNLNLESAVSYGNLLDLQMGYVDTINPSSSLLYNSMNSTSNPMPPNGKLDKCKIELILKWIEQKAKNN